MENMIVVNGLYSVVHRLRDVAGYIYLGIVGLGGGGRVIGRHTQGKGKKVRG